MITATLPEGELHRAIKTISLFTGSTAPVTKLIRMRIVADQVILTATDGFQATMIRVPADIVSDDDEWWEDRRGATLIPASTVATALASLTPYRQRVKDRWRYAKVSISGYSRDAAQLSPRRARRCTRISTDESPDLIVWEPSDERFPQVDRLVARAITMSATAEARHLALDPEYLALVARAKWSPRDRMEISPAGYRKPVLVTVGDHLLSMIMPLRDADDSGLTDPVVASWESLVQG